MYQALRSLIQYSKTDSTKNISKKVIKYDIKCKTIVMPYEPYRFTIIICVAYYVKHKLLIILFYQKINFGKHSFLNVFYVYVVLYC